MAFWKENWQKKPFSVEDQMAADPLYYLTNEVYAPLDAEVALVGTHCGFVDEELFIFPPILWSETRIWRPLPARPSKTGLQPITVS